MLLSSHLSVKRVSSFFLESQLSGSLEWRKSVGSFTAYRPSNVHMINCRCLPFCTKRGTTFVMYRHSYHLTERSVWPANKKTYRWGIPPLVSFFMGSTPTPSTLKRSFISNWLLWHSCIDFKLIKWSAKSTRWRMRTLVLVQAQPSGMSRWMNKTLAITPNTIFLTNGGTPRPRIPRWCMLRVTTDSPVANETSDIVTP